MYRKHFFISAFIALSFLAVAVSCKKDDDSGTTYSDSMTGTLSFDISQYLLVGETVTIDATGITEPDDVTYTWTGSLIGDRDGQYGNDTITGVQSISLTVRDEVGTFTITVKAEADGYYSKQYSKDVVVISPDGTDGSLTDIEYTGKTFRDPRDGKIYNYTTAGNLDWFSQNLDYAGQDEGGKGQPYGRSEAMSYVTGRLYTWNDATGGETSSGLGNGPQGVCPEGWSIPTNEDWEDLAKAISGQDMTYYDDWAGLGEKVTVDAKFNGTRMWPYSPDHTPQNMFCWAALSSGYGNNGYYNFYMLFERGFWWSSTEYDEDNASYRYIYYDNPDFPYFPVDKTDFAASVRCVRLASGE